jgi:AraC-like DNA-binding protein
VRSVGATRRVHTGRRGGSCTILHVPGASPREWVRAWRPLVPGISEVFHARFVEHRYPPHAHSDWTLFVVDDGAIRYDLDRRERGVGVRRVTLLPPNVVHDGRAASEHGFRKRVLYVSPDVLPETLAGRAVARPDVLDPSVLRATRRLHDLLAAPDDALEAEQVMAFVGEGVRAHLGDADEYARARSRGRDLAHPLRELLEEHAFGTFTLTEAARSFEVSPATLVRAFRDAFGITPHRYVVARRIDTARKLLLAGAPLARTATEVGFHDQAHFTHHFRRHVGATPGRFARSGDLRAPDRSRVVAGQWQVREPESVKVPPSTGRNEKS